jgi:muramoyltetrapeptide carboxypeptidase
MPEPFLPPRLQPGDIIAVVHPASPVRDTAALDAGIRILRELNLRVCHVQPSGTDADFLAASDLERVGELHRLWTDPEVKGLITARGGYGCLRIMGMLDLELLRNHPKWLIGFSDLTVLLNGIFSQTGIIGLHGPGVTSLPRINRASFTGFKEMLAHEFHGYSKLPELEILRGGIGRGRLLGGNLTTLCHLIGTPWQPDLNNAVLVLEDTAEPPYKLDRMLTHLACAGMLDNLAGLILGVFDPGHDDRLEILRLSEQLWNRVLELTGSADYPVWGGFPCGHQRENYPLPIGMEVVMESSSGRLDFLVHNCQPG